MHGGSSAHPTSTWGGAVQRGWMLLVALALAATSTIVATPVAADHQPDPAGGPYVDQAIAGDPECELTSDAFPGQRTLVGLTQSQSFTPSRGELREVDLCLTVSPTAAVGLPVTVTIFDEDGDPTASGQTTLNRTGTRWVTFELGDVTLTPAVTYRMEVTGPARADLPSNVVAWRLTCSPGTLTGTCSGATDRYPGGVANPDGSGSGEFGPNADFGFRTSTAHSSDLTASITQAPAHVCPGAGRFSTTVQVDRPAQGTTSDTTVEVFLDGTTESLGSATLSGASTGPALLTIALDVPTLPDGRYALRAVVDGDDHVVETNETNNTSDDAPVKLTGCGESGLDALTATAVNSSDGSGSVPAGVGVVPFDAIADEVRFDGGVGASDAEHLPNGDIWGHNPDIWGHNGDIWGHNPDIWGHNPYFDFNGDIWGHNPDIWGHNGDIWGHNPLRERATLTAPVNFVPVPETAGFLDQVATDSSVGNETSPFFGMPTAVFDAIPVNTIALQRPREWDGYFEGTALEGEFIQNLSLADALALDPPANPPLIHAELVADGGALGRLNVGATSLGATQLVDLPAPRDGWCALIVELGAGCTQNGDGLLVTIDGERTSRPTLVTLDALGFTFGRTLWGPSTEPATLFDLPLDRWLTASGELGIHPLSPLGYVPLLIPVDAETGATFPPLMDPSGTALADVVVDRSMASVVDCEAPGVDCDTGQTTIGQVAQLDAWTPYQRFSHLLAALGTDDLAGLTFSDLLLSVTNDAAFRDLPYQDADLDGLLLAGLVAPGDELVAYEVSFDAADLAAAAVDPTATVTLPVGFAYVADSAAISAPHDGQAAVTAATFGGSGRSSQTLVLSTDLLLGIGHTASLTFLANPGPVLGSFQASVRTQVTDLASDTPSVADVGPTAPIEVTERFEQATEAPYLPEDALVLAHLGTPGDTDTWRVGVPSEPLSEIHISLSKMDGDYDLLASTADTTSMFGNGDIWGHNPDIWGHNGDIWGHNPYANEEIAPETAVSQDATAEAGAVPPQLLEDVPRDPEAFDQRGLRGVSISRGEGVPENLTIKVVEGESGTFNLQVSGYNQASGPGYYVLYHRVIGPKQIDLGACQPLPWTPTTGAEGTLPTIDASNADTDTLFLVPLQRVNDREGPQARQELVDTLAALGSRNDLGVRGLTIPVEADPRVRQAYQRWDTDGRCDPSVANEVAAAVRDVVMDYAVQLPHLQHVVVIGDDNAIPYMRFRDGNTLGHESSFLSTAVMEFGEPGDTAFGTPLTHALRSGMFLFDDHLGTRQMLPWLDQGVFIPTIAVGRISGDVPTVKLAADHFVGAGGRLDPGMLDLRGGVGTGYAHNLDGGIETAEHLDASLAIDSLKLMDEDWNLDDLLGAMAAAATNGPSAVSLNGHADHHHFLTADGNTRRDLSQSLDAKPTGPDDESDLAVLPAGSLILSMGCHVNYDLPVDPGTIRDFGDAVAAGQGMIAANTAYNYGEANTVAAGELFNARFAARLGEDVSVGQAFALAKADAYIAEGNGAWEQLKSMQGMTLLGWPMYRIADSATPDEPAGQTPTRSVDAHGRQYVDVTVDLTFTERTTATGSYFDVASASTSVPVSRVATDPLALDGRPLGPQVVLDVSSWLTGPGEEVRGAELIGLVSTDDQASFDPVFADTVVGAADLIGDTDNTGIFPLRPVVVRSTPTVDDRQLTGVAMRPWTFRSTGASGGQVTGQLRLDEQMTVRVYIGSLAERTHPTIEQVEVDRSGSTLGMHVTTQEAGTGVASVSALYRDAATGGWLLERGFAPATSQLGRTSWEATGTFPTTTQPTELLVNAVTSTGTVALWRNKGDLVSLIQPGTLAFTIEGERGLNGWFTGPITVVLPPLPADAERYEYRDLGGEWVITPRENEFDVSADGLHSLDVRTVLPGGAIGAQVTDVLVAIDQAGPQVTILSPSEGELPDLRAVTFDWECTDSLSGILASACTATLTGPDGTVGVQDGDEIRLPTGDYVLSVTGADLAGNASSASVRFSVPVPELLFEGFFAPVVDGEWNAVDADDDGSDPDGHDADDGHAYLKWRIWSGGEISQDPTLVESITWIEVACDGAAVESTPVPGATPEPAISHADEGIKVGTHYMKFKSEIPRWVDPNCGRVDLTLVDGQLFSAWFMPAG